MLAFRTVLLTTIWLIIFNTIPAFVHAYETESLVLQTPLMWLVVPVTMAVQLVPWLAVYRRVPSFPQTIPCRLSVKYTSNKSLLTPINLLLPHPQK